MKNIAIVLVTLWFIALGTVFSLIAIYAPPDEVVHFLDAGYFWIGNAIAFLGLLIYFRKCTDNVDSDIPTDQIQKRKRMKNIIMILVVFGFIFVGITFALMAIYSSPDGEVHFAEAGYFWIGNAIVFLGALMYFKKSE